MDQSMSMIDAQVQFLEEQLVLVHIPLELYPYFFKPVLRLIFDEIAPLQDSNQDEADVLDDSESISDTGAEYREPAFLNVSITPVEVSVICPRRLVEKYFDPLINQLAQIDASLWSRVDISDNDYIAMQVLGQGLEAGKRVLELTSPLSMAGISIFFITTYFSDYILVPLRSKSSVISTLESRGFQFENSNTAFTNPLTPIIERKLSDAVPPVTPPPSSVAELQARTFENLRKRQILPVVDDTLRLVQCAAHHPYHHQESSMSILRDALAKVLLVDEPRFLSLTLAALDPAASLLLEKRLLPRFSRQTDDDDGGSSLLLGAQGDHLVPIILDLRDLPLEASGIVCGVAGRLAEATSHSSRDDHPDTNNRVSGQQSSVVGSVPKLVDTFGTRLALSDKKSSSQHQLAPATHHLKPNLDSSADAVEISFLSTARAGTIIVGEDELQRAIDALDAEKVQDSPAEMVSEPGEIGLGLETDTVEVS
ncbi:hypothetical protein PMG11_09002 [Penicillium brasilianum]|uniref:Pterin-binding domain-containing protein n=1 Tax=Penicillium brasilianum TaxID=104259 RepID=A0A0F7TZI0_PENBI|nr:hypothetical protein PMG11_09002 [Penicillium brasilianum]